MSEVDPSARASYPAWVSHTLRYNDQDPLGHINNAVYSTFFEAGRTALTQPLLEDSGAANIDTVLVRVVIDYLQELTYPGTVDIGTRVKRIGTKSITFGNGVFKGDTDECVAAGEAVLVFFDTQARKSVEPPTSVRAALESMMTA
jgi:acyl-CoA thioester hydrolase